MITIHLDERDPALLTVSFPADPIGNDRDGGPADPANCGPSLELFTKSLGRSQ